VELATPNKHNPLRKGLLPILAQKKGVNEANGSFERSSASTQKAATSSMSRI